MEHIDGEVGPSIAQLLQAGIAAARAGQRERARDLLTRVTGLDADNVSAWLWRSGVADNPLEQELCLEKVLALDPDNGPAQKGLAIVRKRIIEVLFSKAIAAAEIGEHEQARELLTQVVERDETNLDAWLWLSRMVDTQEDQEVCYENVLALEPDNDEIAEKLATLRQAREAANVNLWAGVEAPEETSRVAPTLASAVLGEAYIQKHTTVVPEPEPEKPSVSAQLWAKYDDELLCPYCATPTEYDDRRCTACGNPLWIKIRRREERSVLLWMLISLQAFSTVMSALGPILILYFISERIDLRDFTKLFGIYFGILGDIPPGIAAEALALLPRTVFFLAWIPVAISAAYTVALYLRWTPIFYLLLGNAVLSLLASIIGLVIFASQGLFAIFGGIFGVLVSVVTFVIVLKLEDDFKKNKWRILLKVDGDIKDGMAFLIRGRRYADQKMWARAAVHFRRAAALLPYQTDGHIAAATSCIRLKDYALAGHILKNAQEIDPEDARIAELIALLEERQNKSAPKRET